MHAQKYEGKAKSWARIKVGPALTILRTHSDQISASWKLSNGNLNLQVLWWWNSKWLQTNVALVNTEQDSWETYIHILKHLTSHNPFSLQQSDFKSGKCTTSALIHITDHWLWEIERNNEICSLFRSAKSTDSVPHQALLAKLYSLGVDNYPLKMDLPLSIGLLTMCRPNWCHKLAIGHLMRAWAMFTLQCFSFEILSLKKLYFSWCMGFIAWNGSVWVHNHSEVHVARVYLMHERKVI